MLQDVAYGLRSLRKNPGITAVALLTLALGIGVNAAMFSVVNAVLLRPLPYRDPGRLVAISAQIPSLNIYAAFVEYHTFGDFWRRQSQSFESMWAYTSGWTNLTSNGEPERLLRARVNAGFLSLIGVRPALGREFLPDEDRPGAPRVAMLSHALWRRRFGGNRGVLGQAITLDRESYTVVGIAPPEFAFYGDDVEIYVPIAASTARGPGMPSVGVHARLKPGVSVTAAQAEIDRICRRWVAQFHYPKDWGARVWPLRDYLVRDVHTSLVALAVAVALVLLIACANVANLLLVRAGARQREIAIRNALGAGSGRIIRQLLTESALLAAGAGALGLAAAWAAARALALGAAYLPLQKNVTIDATVLLFTLAVSLATTLLFGMAPALAAARVPVSENLKEGGRAGEGLRGSRLRSVLVVAEVALALLVAIGATLTARSLARLQAVDPGFRPEGLLKAYVTLPAESYREPTQRLNFFQGLAERVAAIPGVTASGMASELPFGGSKSGSDVIIEGAPPRKPGEQLIAFSRAIDPGYFPAMGVRLLRGRFFDAHDPAGPPVAMVNETMARRGWPGQDPVGKRFGGGRDHWVTVVGLIGDLRQTSLADEPDMEWYMPYAQSPGPTMAVVARSAGNPMRLAPALRAAVRGMDPDLALSEMGTLSDRIAHSTRARRFSVALFAGFALLALLLAAVGIYGVVSYSVARRTHEIGVRMALGAARSRIEGMVVGRAALLGGVGVAIGAAAGLGLTRLLRSMLFGISATDPAVFAGVSLFLLAVAALAGYVPARRAASVDPGAALRDE